jgi:hypothetical protein
MSCVRYAAVGALGVSLIAAIPVMLSLQSSGMRLLWIFPAYFVGFGGAGAAYWALQRIAHLATGRYLMGAIGGFCVYFSVAPVTFLLEDERFDLEMTLVIATIAGGLVGPAVALSKTDDLGVA